MRHPYFRQVDALFNTSIGLLPAIVFWLTTSWGIGAAVDSVRYYDMAQIFLNGRELTELGTHFPPLYPFVISLLTHVTDDIPGAARILQFFLIAANASLAALLVHQLTNGNRMASFLVVIAMTLRHEFFFLWHYALSESLFTGLLLLHYLCLIQWQRKGRTKLLFVSGMLLGLMVITRYAGLPFIGFSVIAVALFCRHLPISRILYRIGVLVGGASVFPLAWILLATSSGLASEPRKIGFYPIDSTNLQDGITAVGYWLNQGLGFPAGVIVAVILIYASWWFIRNNDSTSRAWLWVFLLSIVGYMIFVVISTVFFDAAIKLQLRIFYPALTIFLLAAAVMLGTGSDKNNRVTRLVFPLALVFIAAGSSPAMYVRALTRIHQGEGFANALYRNMDIWNYKDRYIQDRIVSNGPELISLHMNRKAVTLPQIYDMVTLQANTDHDAQLSKLRQEVLQGNVTVVYFAAMQWREELPTAQSIVDLMQIQPDYQTEKVVVFHVPDSKS